jgi:hypothetical protein
MVGIKSGKRQRESPVLLATGRYAVRIETGETRFCCSFQVKAGETRTFKLARSLISLPRRSSRSA